MSAAKKMERIENPRNPKTSEIKRIQLLKREADRDPFMSQFVERSTDHGFLASEFTTSTVGGLDSRDDHLEII
ncbi:MAG: hypothetical protein WD095_01925 [Candidatus Paceibacterota bacterium]